ncbi:MAG: hypothetical protein CMH63_03680 [Nanoarchaeota archaeon]|nr:hypothetical protein [Nanoarchaeota archaeon]|tara:strand:- start:31108 stop:31365 length:258 start_codon:yes stop_codon:yes gene_type:complete
MVGGLPIKKFRSGSIDCSVWSNKREIERDGEKMETEFKTVSLRKSWNKDGKWYDHTITNIRRNDIARMILLLQKAQEELLLAKEG